MAAAAVVLVAAAVLFFRARVPAPAAQAAVRPPTVTPPPAPTERTAERPPRRALRRPTAEKVPLPLPVMVENPEPKAPEAAVVAETLPDARTPFVALVEQDRLDDVESLQVIEVEVPRAEIGAPFEEAPGEPREAPVRAEVLVGHDGVARAIRFIDTDKARRGPVSGGRR